MSYESLVNEGHALITTLVAERDKMLAANYLKQAWRKDAEAKLATTAFYGVTGDATFALSTIVAMVPTAEQQTELDALADLARFDCEDSWSPLARAIEKAQLG